MIDEFGEWEPDCKTCRYYNGPSCEARTIGTFSTRECYSDNEIAENGEARE